MPPIIAGIVCGVTTVSGVVVSQVSGGASDVIGGWVGLVFAGTFVAALTTALIRATAGSTSVLRDVINEYKSDIEKLEAKIEQLEADNRELVTQVADLSARISPYSNGGGT